MEIQDLPFEPANLRKLAAHRISRQDVLDAVESDAWAVDTHDDYPRQVRVIGPTRAGRMLTVAMDPTSDPGTWRPVTGWESDAREQRYHREWMTER